MSVILMKEKMHDLLGYVYDNFVSQNGSDDVIFHVTVWNHFDSDGPRTNNLLEGYSSMLNKYITAKSSIYQADKGWRVMKIMVTKINESLVTMTLLRHAG